uniref:AT08427p n=1 Tax=Drosophila melanogaster TaxID=7227 RepID=Q8MZE3_DROME|nr:AT08427p [Drosophila melanogaster]
MVELDEDAQSFRSVTKMLSQQANFRIFKEHIDATVELSMPIDTCSRLEAYVDYFTSAIIEAARQATPTPHQVGENGENHQHRSTHTAR